MVSCAKKQPSVNGLLIPIIKW